MARRNINRRMTQAQAVIVNRFFEVNNCLTHYTVDNTCDFTGHWNDEKITDAINDENGWNLSPTSIAKLRVDLYGRLRSRVQTKAELQAKCERLEDQLKSLGTAYTELDNRYEAVVQKLEEYNHGV